VYSRVFAARDENGNPVVVKLSDSSREWWGYSLAREAAAKLPGELAKHLPKVFFAGMIKDHPNWVPGKGEGIVEKMSLIVMEPLRQTSKVMGSPADRLTGDAVEMTPLTQEEAASFANELGKQVKQMIQNFVVEPEKSVKFRKGNVTRITPGVKARDKSDFLDKLWNNAEKAISNSHEKASSYSFMQALFTKWCDQVWERHGLREHDISVMYSNKQFLTQIIPTKMMSWWTSHVMMHKQIDDTADMRDRKVTTSAVNEKFTQLSRALEELGYSIVDIHGSNVMIRPGTGDIVISDVGGMGKYGWASSS
jgi:hypothetical protein